MTSKFIAKVNRTIHATPARVWQALTDPAEIKEYLFGTDTQTDWKKGSPITYTGVWQGKPYEDKGVIKDIEPEKLLHTTYLSGMSGKEDIPENYANVVYTLEKSGDDTILTLTQDNIDSEEGKKHMEDNWAMVLDGLKKTVEK